MFSMNSSDPKKCFRQKNEISKVDPATRIATIFVTKIVYLAISFQIARANVSKHVIDPFKPQYHTQLVRSIPRLSTVLPSTGQNQCYGNTLLYMTSVFMADHDINYRCLVEKNVPIVFILSSRWQDGDESLGMETTSCL